MATSTKGSEGFSVDKNGKRVDAHIHDEILDNPEAEDNNAHHTLKWLIKEGYPDEMIKDIARQYAENQLKRKPKSKKLARGGIGTGYQDQTYHPRHPAGMIKSSIPGRTDKIPMSVPPGSYILPADIPSALGQGNTMAGEKILGTMFRTGPYSPQSTAQLSGPLQKGPRPPRLPNLKRIHKLKFAEGGEPKFNYRAEDFPTVTKHEITGSYPLTKDLDLTGKAHTFSGSEVPLRRKPDEWGASIGLRKSFQEGGTPEPEGDDIPIIAAGGEYVIHPDQVRKIGHGNLEAGHKVLDRFVLNTRKSHIETLKKLKPPKK